MADARYYVVDSSGNIVLDSSGNPMTTTTPPGSGPNKTGVDQLSPTRDVWKGGSRGSAEGWTAPQFTQTYGNYTGLFPSMGQQVGQALFGSIQPRDNLPSWYQSQLPQRQNRIVDVRKYFGNNPALQDQQFSSRTMNNPYPLNGSLVFGKSNVSPVTNASNPFIGAYAGLTGYNPGQQQVGQPPQPVPQTPPPSNPFTGTPIPPPTSTPNAPGFNPAPATGGSPNPPPRAPVQPYPPAGTPVPIAYPQQPPVTRAPVSQTPTPPINLGPGAPAAPSIQYPRPPSQTPFGQYPAPLPSMQSPRPTNPYAPTTGTPVGIQQPQGAQPGMDQQTINSILSYFLR